MKYIEKIRNKNNIPILLFFIVLINYIPLFIGNFGPNADYAVTVKEMTICFAIELVLLAIFLFKRVKLFKNCTIVNFIILTVTTIILFLIQVKNFFTGNYEKFDFINIICIFINLFMLYVMFLNLEIEEKYIYYFFALMTILGVVACIVNVYLFKEEILTMITTAKFISVKSFFAHRNQFAFFLFVSIISNVMLILKSDKRKNKALLFIPLVILGASLITSSSRTGIATTALFIILFFISTNSIKLRHKFLIVFLLVALLITGGIIVESKYPDIVEKSQVFIEQILIRKDTIKNFTGREWFWKIAKETLSENAINLSFGIGRFLAIDLLEHYAVTQYHSFYIEALMTGGVMELIFFIGIFIFVFGKIIKSKLDTKYKQFYAVMYISFFIYGGFESLCRFSIGCVDTLCLIFFITIPLLHSNTYTIENKSAQEIETKRNFIKNKEQEIN